MCAASVIPSFPLRDVSICYADSSSLKQQRQILDIIEVWKKTIQHRLSVSQPHKDVSAEALQQFKEDNKTAADYSGVLESIKRVVCDLQKIPVILFTEGSYGVDGLCVASIKMQGAELYIHGLASAPWNIAMHAGLCGSQKEIQRKGVGTSLLQACYRLAQIKKISTITTISLSSAHEFYKKRGMTFDSDIGIFTYEVTDQTPPALI